MSISCKSEVAECKLWKVEGPCILVWTHLLAHWVTLMVHCQTEQMSSEHRITKPMASVKMDDEDKSKWEWNQKDTSPVSQSCRWKTIGVDLNFSSKLWPCMVLGFDLISQRMSRHGLIRQSMDEWFRRMWLKSKVGFRKTSLRVRSTWNLEAPRLLKAWLAVEKVGPQPRTHESLRLSSRSPKGSDEKHPLHEGNWTPSKKEPDKTALLGLWEMVLRWWQQVLVIEPLPGAKYPICLIAFSLTTILGGRYWHYHLLQNEESWGRERLSNLLQDTQLVCLTVDVGGHYSLRATHLQLHSEAERGQIFLKPDHCT